MKSTVPIAFSRRRSRLARPGLAIALAAAITTLPNLPARAATDYFDPNDTTALGGAGTFTAQGTALYSATSAGGGTLIPAAAGDTGVFDGTGGLVTFSATYALALAQINVSGYTFSPTTTTAEQLTAPINLAAGVNLGLDDPSQVGNSTLSVSGSISGGAGSSLTIQGAQALGGTGGTTVEAARINLLGTGSIISVPITINGTGTGGVAGVVATGKGEVLSAAAAIANNSSEATNLGATSGNDLTANGVVSGSAGLFLAAGSSGGAGTVTLAAANTYTGPTTLNGTASGAVKLGVDNALPVGTALTFGSTSGNGQKLDLNGHNQTIGSLASGTGATGSIVDSATGTSGTDTLTVTGTAATSFGLVIADGATRTVALALGAANTGTLTLTGVNTFSGGVTVGGGKLVLANATGSSATGTSAVALSGGMTTTLSGNGFSTGLLTVTAGSRIAPGVNVSGANTNFGTPATLSLGTTGGMTLTNASLDFDLSSTAAGANDSIATGGALSLAMGRLVFTFNETGGTLDTGTAYQLITGAASVGGFGTANITAAFVGGSNYNATFTPTAGGLQVAFSPVPEPSTWAAMLLGLGLLGLARCRRRGRA